MKKIFALMLALLCVFGSLLTEASAEPIPQNAMVATAHERIQASVGTDTAGAAVVLIAGGELLMQEGFGYADLPAKRLITPETVFEIGEISSIFVALSAYRLAELGGFSLTEDITRYLPAELVRELAFSYPVTAEQLLLGCAGLEGRTFDLRFDEDSYRFETLEQALLAQVPRQIAEPGSFYAASPFGVALVAYAIECVSGVPYETFATERILMPLGLQDTVLNPTAATELKDVALGHVMSAEGCFATAADGGRSYAGLYPYDGALSSARDMTRVMELLLYGNTAVLSEDSRLALVQKRFDKGLFTLSAPALSVQGGAVGRNAATDHFGASLWLDVVNGKGAVVLTNTASCALTALPAELCGGRVGVAVQGNGELPELDTFAGFFANAESESSSFVGRLLRKDHNAEAVANEDGTLSFLDMRLVQIAPCVFADADGDPTVAVAQFFLNEEGDVEQVVTADGRTYLSVGFLEHGTVNTVLFVLLILLSVGFLIAGVFSVLRYAATRRDPEAKSFVYTLPLALTALIGVCSLLQIFVGIQYGARAFFSLFEALTVIALLLCIGATLAFVLAFMASLTRRKMPGRVVRSSALFLGYVLLLWHWGIIIL